MDTLEVALLNKALGEKRSHTRVRKFYGQRSLVDDLDIINELGGHTGCVNALRLATTSENTSYSVLTMEAVGRSTVTSWPRVPMTPT